MCHATVWYNSILNHENKVVDGILKKKCMLIKSTHKYIHENLEHLRNMVHVADSIFHSIRSTVFINYQEPILLCAL